MLHNLTRLTQNGGVRIIPNILMLLLTAGIIGQCLAETRVGVAKIDITPEGPVRLSGYAVRTNEHQGVSQRIYAKALSIAQADESPALIVTVENCGISEAIHEEVAKRLREKKELRSERLVVCSTHTHSAPLLDGALPNMFAKDVPEEHQARVRRYTQDLIDKLERVAGEALEKMQPAKIFWGQGKASFAKNRRTAGGPVDHDMPLLAARDENGKVIALLANYACHCTTLGGEWNQVHGDWAGFAQEFMEAKHPGAIALVTIGCGADANPHPRGQLEHARSYGQQIADEAQLILGRAMTELTAPLECREKRIELPFDPLPTRAQWDERAKQPGIVGYHARRNLQRLDRGEQLPTTLRYLITSWNFGDALAMVFLPGEVVVDYALRLKRELDAERIWVHGYANYVPCYIPSKRILQEGGYEAESSLWYYDRPARLAPGTEDLIVQTVYELVPDSFAVDPKRREHPAPKNPEQSLRSLRTRPELEIELVAAEPFVVSPVAIDWGADGKLWVVEMRDFPQGMDGNWKPGGRVKFLEDLDQDGRFDQATIFLEDVPFPTGITAWNGGVLVCAAPDILYARDTNSDGKADWVKKLFSGFATDNYQARVNSLSLGLDGWFYGANGLIGGTISGSSRKSHVNISGRDFRFNPATGEFQTASGLTQQGRARDDFGNWFGCDNSTLIWHYPLPETDLRRNPYFAPPATRVAIASDKDPNQLYPLSPMLERFNDPHHAKRTTAACGLGIYRDRLLGKGFFGNAFVCEPVHNLVRRLVLREDGATFKASKAADEQDREFLASYDNWFRPVQARTGPDGALWVVDMYRLVVEHPRWITPERLKMLPIRAGEDMGRIYRIFPKDARPRAIADLTKLSATDLARKIGNSNGTERDRVHLELIRRGGKSAGKPLSEIAQFVAAPEIRIQALSLLNDLGLLSSKEIATALSDGNAAIRRFAVQLARDAFRKDPSLKAKVLSLADDPDLKVRFEVALAAGETSRSKAPGTLAKIYRQDRSNQWTRSAVLSGSPPIARPLLEELVALGDLDQGTFLVLFQTALNSGTPQSQPGLIRLLDVGSAARLPEMFRFKAVAEVLRVGRNNGRVHAAIRRDLRARETVDRTILNARKVAQDPNADQQVKAAAMQLLIADPASGGNTRDLLLQVLNSAAPGELPKIAAEGLVASADHALTGLLKHWSTMAPSARHAVIDAAFQREKSILPMLTHLERSSSLAEVPLNLRQRLLNHKTPEIRLQAERLFPSRTSRSEALRVFEPALHFKGDPLSGSRLFAQHCATCHHYRGQGFDVGPNIAALTDRSANFLLTAIVDPNAAVENRYLTYTIDTPDGESHSGVIAEENATSVTLVNAGGLKQSILRNQVKNLQPSNVSLMPEGLEQTVSVAEMADLIAFLQTNPSAFGSAGAEQAAKARSDFQTQGSRFRITAAAERSEYSSWIGRLPLHHCRQTDGRSRVAWQTSLAASAVDETGFRRFIFPVGLGFISQPAGAFDLAINGKHALKFDVTLNDQTWESDNRAVRLHYLVMDKNDQDSSGVLTILINKELVENSQIEFAVTGSHSGSQRWFGIYELPNQTANLRQ